MQYVSELLELQRRKAMGDKNKDIWDSVLINVKVYGATGDGVTDDTAAIQSCFNDNVGHTVDFPDGTYLISSPLLLPVGVSLNLSENAIIKASKVMDAIIQTPTDLAHNNGLISGGKFDCNKLAVIGIHLRWINMFRVQNVQVENYALVALKLGSNAASSSYEALVENFRCRRYWADPYPVGSVGILFEHCGDSHIDNAIIMGCEFGLKGGVSDSKFSRIHTWNTMENGAMRKSYDIDGWSNSFSQCQADGPLLEAAWHIKQSWNTVSESEVNLAATSYGEVDNRSVGILLDSGVQFSGMNNKFQGGFDARLKSDYAGDLSNAVIMGTQGINVITQVGTRLFSSTLQAIDIYVDAVNGDNLNDGATLATAFKTIARAVSRLAIDRIYTIRVSPGTYNELVFIDGLIGKAQLTIQGGVSLADAANYKVSQFQIQNSTAKIVINGFQVTTTTDHAVSVIRSNAVTLNNIDASASAAFKGLVCDFSNVILQNSGISNKSYAIHALNCSRLLSNTNQGTSNTNVLFSSEGSSIFKISTQPSGTTAEGTFGGQIL